MKSVKLQVRDSIWKRCYYLQSVSGSEIIAMPPWDEKWNFISEFIPNYWRLIIGSHVVNKLK